MGFFAKKKIKNKMSQALDEFAEVAKKYWFRFRFLSFFPSFPANHKNNPAANKADNTADGK